MAYYGTSSEKDYADSDDDCYGDYTETESEEESLNYEIITTRETARCREVVNEIMASRTPVAVDSEGVSLGAKGRMTLLQICTWEGQVYLIDLIEPNDPMNTKYAQHLMRHGLIARLLTSIKNEKVFHACTNDSAALYHQFGIKLIPSQVMDLQVANVVLQRQVNERVFVKKRRLNELAERYETPVHPNKDIHLDWMRANYRMWEERPLTYEMIQYAVHDVSDLIPQLYNALRSRLADAKAFGIYRLWVGWEIDQQIDNKRVSNERRMSHYTAIRDLFMIMSEHHTWHTRLSRLDDDKKQALRMVDNHLDMLSPAVDFTIEKLEERLLKQDVRDWETLRRQTIGHLKLPENEWNRLQALCQHRVQAVRDLARGLRNKLISGQKKKRGGRGK